MNLGLFSQPVHLSFQLCKFANYGVIMVSSPHQKPQQCLIQVGLNLYGKHLVETIVKSKNPRIPTLTLLNQIKSVLQAHTDPVTKFGIQCPHRGI